MWLWEQIYLMFKSNWEARRESLAMQYDKCQDYVIHHYSDKRDI